MDNYKGLLESKKLLISKFNNLQNKSNRKFKKMSILYKSKITMFRINLKNSKKKKNLLYNGNFKFCVN